MKLLRGNIKQILKMIVQHFLLPLVYRFWQIVYWKKALELIVFADAHHEHLPFSMQVMHETLISKGYNVQDFLCDYGKKSALAALAESIKFMRLYAQAKYVFICDNFLPVAACKKNPETQVIQLWHSCGLLKKMGYDTGEDVPRHYIGNVYKNYDLVTVSAPCCVAPLTGGMRQQKGVVQPLGVSRTDIYFNKEWTAQCREDFYVIYPDAVGKKVILWAPTFRGNAADPYQVGAEEIKKLEHQLDNKCLLLYKFHPHIERQGIMSNCSMPTERLLPVVDVMITDYSSVVFDYLLFGKPFVLFAPDLKDYERTRGFYIDYHALSPYVAQNSEELISTVHAALAEENTKWIYELQQYHLASCDGAATDRILEYVGL